MAHLTGESKREGLRVDFDHRLDPGFHGSQATSDGRVLAPRELDDTLGLTETAGGIFQDSRSGLKEGVAAEMIGGELCPDEAGAAENRPTEAQCPDEGRAEAKDLGPPSAEAAIRLHFRRPPGFSGKCRFSQR